MVESVRKYKVNYSHLHNESSSTFSTVRVDELADLVGEKSALNKLGDHLSHSLRYTNLQRQIKCRNIKHFIIAITATSI